MKEEEAHKTEEEAQHDYEDSMADLKKEQADLSKTLADLQDQLAEAEHSLLQTRENLPVTEKRGKEKEALEKAIKLLKGPPAYKAAVNAAEQEALGDCKDICNTEGRDHAKCKACLAGVSVPGYCAGHKDTPGC